ncbi:MAG TPA: PqqD family protein [Blastocatellia bacterium]|nr:PqqD family protein [Blastocatellia bacterium]
MQIEKSPSTVFNLLEDKTGVLLNLDTLVYYSLNRTGAAIWEQIESEKQVSLDDLARAVCERFDIDEHSARQHLRAFVDRLVELQMARTV